MVNRSPDVPVDWILNLIPAGKRLPRLKSGEARLTRFPSLNSRGYLVIKNQKPDLLEKSYLVKEVREPIGKSPQI